MTKRIVALTDKRIAAQRPGAKRITLYDPVVPGLAVRVQPSGHKSFMLGARYPDVKQLKRRRRARPPGDKEFTRRSLGMPTRSKRAT